jgi:L-ribulose-5-phosphate 4-epimerase
MKRGTQVNEQIQRVRQEVLDAAKKMVKAGLVASVWGNLSARVADSDLVVVTPSGVEYETLTVNDLVVVRLDTGDVVEGSLKPTSELNMHLAILRARPDVGGVMHTHSVYASACAVARCSIPPLIEDMAQVVGGAVSVARYALPGTVELGQHVVQALGNKGAALLANHGVVGVGETISEALRVCVIVEKAAQIFALSKMIGSPVLLSQEDVDFLRHVYKTSYGQKKST